MNQTTAAPADHRAFEVLVREHHRRLMGYAISLCRQEDAAKDIVQDAFVVAWEKMDTFDPSRDFGAWMRGIVRNKSREWFRSQDLVGMEDDLLEILESQHRRWDSAVNESGRDILRALDRCVQKLPELLGDVVDLFYFKGLSGADTADRVDADPATVRKRLQRARHQLGQCIEATGTTGAAS